MLCSSGSGGDSRSIVRHEAAREGHGCGFDSVVVGVAFSKLEPAVELELEPDLWMRMIDDDDDDDDDG